MNWSKMNWSNIIMTLLLLLGANYLYDKFHLYQDSRERTDDLDLIKKYLLGENNVDSEITDLHNVSKPILWIHIEYNKNSRNWCSFGSRTTIELNMPYIYLTIQSIIKHCGADFHICILDDFSFKKLLPDYTTDLQKVANPIRQHLRNEALLEILYKYGGVLMENSFICFNSIKEQYDIVETTGQPMVGEFLFNQYSENTEDFMPSMKFIGGVKECPVIGELLEFLKIRRLGQNLDFASAEAEFNGTLDKHLLFFTQTGKIRLVDGLILGTKCVNPQNPQNQQIDLEDILTSTDLELSSKALLFYIPRNEILERSRYNWVVRMSPTQILESNTNLGKYLLKSL